MIVQILKALIIELVPEIIRHIQNYFKKKEDEKNAVKHDKDGNTDTLDKLP